MQRQTGPLGLRRVGTGLVAALVASALISPTVAPAPVGRAQEYVPRDTPSVLADPAAYTIQEWELPASQTNSAPQGRAHSITVAPDGRVWYAGLQQGNLGMFDPATQTFRVWDTPTRVSRPHGIQAAPDGMIWVTLTGIPQNKMARFDPTTELWTEYLLPRPNPYPHTVWVARNGDVFFTYEYGDGVGRIDQEQQRVTDWALPTHRGRPYGIEEGPDGNIWVVEFTGNKIVRLNPRTGEVSYWSHPRAVDDPGLRRLAIDAQGRVWFVEHEWGSIGRFDPQTETWQSWWMPRGPNGRRDQAYALNFDSTGRLYVSNFGGNYIGRFDPQTESWTVYPLGEQQANCRLMAIDKNDVLWCAASAVPRLIRLEAQ